MRSPRAVCPRCTAGITPRVCGRRTDSSNGNARAWTGDRATALDAVAVSFAIDPTTQSGRVQLIVGQIETLSDAGRIASGNFNALVSYLESALAALDESKAHVAKSSLEAFVRLVENYQALDRLTAAEVDALISAASAIADEL